MAAWKFPTTQSYLQHMDELGVERALVLSNYRIPVQQQPFSLNDLVLDCVSSDRLRGGLGVSFLPQNKEMTLPLTDPLGLSAEAAADEVHSLRVRSEQRSILLRFPIPTTADTQLVKPPRNLTVKLAGTGHDYGDWVDGLDVGVRITRATSD